MTKGRRRLLVGQTYNRREEFAPLRRYADIYWLDDMDAEELARVLPSIDCLYSHGWPEALDAKEVSKMKNLRFFQTGIRIEVAAAATSKAHDADVDLVIGAPDANRGGSG